MAIFSIINLIIFVAIACIHIYWALGGKKGITQVIPQLEKGEAVFSPGPIATLSVAIGLLGFALVHFIALEVLWSTAFPYTKAALYGIAAIFGLRGIGDFKYVGLFKKIKGNDFAKNDSLYYTPICWLIVINALLTSTTIG